MPHLKIRSLSSLAVAFLILYHPTNSLSNEVRNQRQIEADWLVQARLRYARTAAADDEITRAVDAAGGCDGIIDGKWGFHTSLERDPWWQVDLGSVQSVDRIVLYNRCDRLMGRASRIRVLLSEDGQTYDLAYEHDGTVFLGFPDKKPLVVDMQTRRARYVRLCLPGQTYFHLDEVQVFAVAQRS